MILEEEDEEEEDGKEDIEELTKAKIQAMTQFSNEWNKRLLLKCVFVFLSFFFNVASEKLTQEHFPEYKKVK